MASNMDVLVGRVDSLGRVYIPAKWRKNWRKVILVRLEDGSILIRPLKRSLRFSDLFDSIEVDVSPEEFLDFHRLRSKMYEEVH